jgi:hypothetical protein
MHDRDFRGNFPSFSSLALSGETQVNRRSSKSLLGTLHIDILVGRKLLADQIVSTGTRVEVIATPEFKSFLQIVAD